MLGLARKLGKPGIEEGFRHFRKAASGWTTLQSGFKLSLFENFPSRAKLPWVIALSLPEFDSN
jgi:hypothetical protein